MIETELQKLTAAVEANTAAINALLKATWLAAPPGHAAPAAVTGREEPKPARTRAKPTEKAQAASAAAPAGDALGDDDGGLDDLLGGGEAQAQETFTMDDVRAALLDLPRPVVQKIISTFGTKLSDIKPERYADVMDAVRKAKQP